MMLIEQSVAPLQFVRLEQSHLQAVQDDLILGAGHPKFFAHAPKLEKSEGACPAKRVYAFPLNYLHGVMDWRWRAEQGGGQSVAQASRLRVLAASRRQKRNNNRARRPVNSQARTANATRIWRHIF